MFRLDIVDAPSWATSPFQKTKEGYLAGRACVTQIGVFPYTQADGSVVRELRCPEEVFKQESMDSLKLQPLTNNHPNFAVTAASVKEVQVGNLGSNPAGDNVYLTVDMVIQDQDAVNDVVAGKRELSCGYSCDIDETPGVWGGMNYDVVQRNIRYNHVAIVDIARAGDAARIRLDAAGNAVINSDSNNSKEEIMAEPITVDVKLDTSDIQKMVETEKARADSLQSNLDALNAEKAKVEAERDTHKDRADKAEAKVKELEKARADEAAKRDAEAKKASLAGIAKKIGVEVADSMDNVAVQKAVILKAFPKANLDGKDQVYIDARFDGAVEQLESELNADAETRKLNADSVDKNDTKDAPSADKARQAYIDRLNKKSKE